MASPPASITGVLAASIPLPTAALTGTVPVLGVLAASVPLPVAALTGDAATGVQYPLRAGPVVDEVARLRSGTLVDEVSRLRAGAIA